MTYQIFARKYRPKTFEDMVGQSTIVQTLQNAVKSGRIAQAYLFSGMRGVGKTTAARILAKALNCAKGPTPTPCNVCESCKEIDEDRSIDVLEIDGASNRQVADIEPIRDTGKYKPISRRYKVIYIDEVHMLSTHAFNALLKILEEPPPSTIFIFATTELHKVPPTIISRCQHFEFKKVSRKDLIHHLGSLAAKEKLTVTDFGLSLIAEASEGSLRDAQSLLDQAVAFCGETIADDDLKEILGTVNRELLFEFSTAVLEEKPDRIFALTAKVIDAGIDLRVFHGELIQHFRNLLIVRTVEKPEDLLAFGADDLGRLKEEAAKGSTEDLLRYLQALQSTEGHLRNSSHPQITFETTLVKLCHFRKIVELKDLVRDLSDERTAAPSPRPAMAVPPAQRGTVAPPRPSFNIGRPKPPDPVPPEAPAAKPVPAPVPARPDEPLPKKERAVDKALAQPGIKAFADRYKARVVSIEPVKGRPETKPDGGEE